jgi:hypothetical protein
MNCDECKDRVLELIDRERSDPDAVREVLSQCPECRALFEETKATLQLAERLPLEEPPAAIDEAVLQAAREHASRVVPLARRRFRPVPWAAAAVALLAVGVGVWSIPKSGPPTSEPSSLEVASDTEVDRRDAAASPVQSVALKEEKAEPRDSRVASAPTVAKKSARPAASSSEPSSALRTRAARRIEVEEEAMAGASEAAFADEAVAAPAPAGRANAKGQFALSSDCERRADAVAKADEVSGEDALALGRCYRDAEDYAEARRWLKRAAADPKTRKRAKRLLRSLPDGSAVGD